LEDLAPGAVVDGVVPGRQVTAVAVAWHGSAAVTLTYRDSDGTVGERLLYHSDEPALRVGGERVRWSFNADAETFTLASEARRISPSSSAGSPPRLKRSSARSSAAASASRNAWTR
jgi:hypothetical protein